MKARSINTDPFSCDALADESLAAKVVELERLASAWNDWRMGKADLQLCLKPARAEAGPDAKL